ncbi:MAG: hypothetical protein Q9220_006583 [cf. Caloplaca sp. 1 TL-2023]
MLDHVAKSRHDHVQPSMQNTETWPFHANTELLQQSADAGCHLCSLLNLQSRPRHNDPFQLKLVNNADGDEWDKPKIEIEQTGDAGGSSLSLIDEQDILKYFKKDYMSQRSWRTVSTASVATLELVRGWIHQCSSSHTKCSSQGILPRLGPRRLLHTYWGQGEIIVRLVECHQEASILEYLTLSHCWGHVDVLELTCNTYKTFVQRIPLEKLPQTYKDAVDITIRLGYNYLWVDSLCIFQDSPKDFAQEAASMGAIYANSVCRIAALDSKDSHGGCYAKRTPLAFYPCQVLTRSGHKLYLQALRARGLQQQKRPRDATDRQFAILQTRGWAVQERELAARTVYFSSIGITWECCITEEHHEDDGPILSDLGRHNLDISRILRAHSYKSASKIPVDHWVDQWWRLVELYSRKDLTYISDRWIAISGLANLFQAVTRSPSIYGLWRVSLLQDLLWYSSIPGDRRLDNGAPSWSWLSIDGQVRNPQAFGSTRKFKARILGLSFIEKDSLRHTEPENVDQRPSVKVRAPMRRYQIRESPLESHEGRMTRKHHDLIDWTDSDSFDHAIQTCIESGNWQPDFTSIDLVADIWALFWAYNPPTIAEGLVVRPLAQSPGGWYRIGSFCVGIRDHDIKVKPFTAAVQSIQLY